MLKSTYLLSIWRIVWKCKLHPRSSPSRYTSVKFFVFDTYSNNIKLLFNSISCFKVGNFDSQIKSIFLQGIVVCFTRDEVLCSCSDFSIDTESIFQSPKVHSISNLHFLYLVIDSCTNDVFIPIPFLQENKGSNIYISNLSSSLALISRMNFIALVISTSA